MIHVVTYQTESGDRGVAAVYSDAPTEGHLATLTRERFAGEIDIEEGETVRLIFYDVAAVEIEPLPEPSEPIPSI